MRELVWDKTLSVTVDEIDEDHRRLVELLNLFNRSVAEDESPEYREALLEELIACTIWHFRHEERLMLKYNYPKFTGHKADFEYLEHWLTEHILVVDMKLGEWLTGVM